MDGVGPWFLEEAGMVSGTEGSSSVSFVFVYRGDFSSARVVETGLEKIFSLSFVFWFLVS